MCKLCGGKCCKLHGGQYIPQDFKQPITVLFILSLLHSDKIAIDWWEGDAKKDAGLKNNNLDATYYLRPRHVNEPAIKGSWGGQCMNWSPEIGCTLKKSKRPYQCRMLVPDYKGGKHDCVLKDEDKASKQDCAIAWYDYQDILNEAIENYQKC